VAFLSVILMIIVKKIELNYKGSLCSRHFFMVKRRVMSSKNVSRSQICLLVLLLNASVTD
jgi:hypothetical protein